MKKDDIEKVLKQMAIEYAKEYKYNKGHEDKRKSKYKLGMCSISSDTDEDYYFVQYGTTNKTNYKRNGGYVEFRYRFDNPVLGIHLPNDEGFASIEFSEYDIQKRENTGNWHYSQSQIFEEKGIELFNEMYKRFWKLYEEL